MGMQRRIVAARAVTILRRFPVGVVVPTFGVHGRDAQANSDRSRRRRSHRALRALLWGFVLEPARLRNEDYELALPGPR